jgi:hypothetical protein
MDKQEEIKKSIKMVDEILEDLMNDKNTRYFNERLTQIREFIELKSELIDKVLR